MTTPPQRRRSLRGEALARLFAGLITQNPFLALSSLFVVEQITAEVRYVRT